MGLSPTLRVAAAGLVGVVVGVGVGAVPVRSATNTSQAGDVAAAEHLSYVSAIQVNPKRPSTVYAGVGHQGVLKSTDVGKTWSAANKGLTAPPVSPPGSAALRVDALALDVRSPNILYAGTGLGVFKTNDGAKTWKLASTGIDLGDRLAHRLSEGFIYALAIDPLHTSTVYAAGDGVWKSTNGGATWKRLLQHGAVNLGIDPRRPETVYVSSIIGLQRSTLGLRGAIRKTVDGGDSWRATGPPGLRDNYFGHPIVVDSRSPGIVYAGGSRGLYASANQGRTWSRLLPLQRAFSGVNAIALDPSRANVLHVGTSTRGVMKSEDGGRTWSEPRLDERYISALAIAPTRPQTIYAGAQWQAVPSVATAGIFASTDGGNTWRRIR